MAGHWLRHQQFPNRVVHAGHETRPVGGSVHDYENRDTYANTICIICADEYGSGGEANARVIAASLDILAALADLEALLVEIAPEYAESTVAANARAAIAKASPRTEETS